MIDLTNEKSFSKTGNKDVLDVSTNEYIDVSI